MAGKANSPASAADGWDDDETVSEAAPTMVEFDEFGDVFVGVYRGKETITDPNTLKEWTRYNFNGVYPDELAGELCGINSTYDLDRGFGQADIQAGDTVRIQYVKDVPTGKGNPMKSFEIKRRKGTRVTAS